MKKSIKPEGKSVDYICPTINIEKETENKENTDLIEKALKKDDDENKILYRKLIINTTNVIDSHLDLKELEKEK